MWECIGLGVFLVFLFGYVGILEHQRRKQNEENAELEGVEWIL